MANVHMQAAARNLRQAVNDVNLKIQQTKNDTEHEVANIERRLNEIKVEQASKTAILTQTDDSVRRAGIENDIRVLEQEASNLRQEIFTLRDDFRKAESELNGQKAELEGLASQLEATA